MMNNIGNVLKSLRDSITAQTKEIVALRDDMKKTKTPPSATSAGAVTTPPATATVPPEPVARRSLTFTLSKAEMSSIPAIAAQLFYSLGGWAIRWSSTKVSCMHDIL